MKKGIILSIVGVLVLIAGLGGIKVLQIGRMSAQALQTQPAEVVTAAVAGKQTWEASLPAVGSLQAVHGVTVEAELTGKVVQIAFEPGTKVRAGDLLVKQDTSSEEAQLRAAEAATTLAKTNLERLRGLFAKNTVSMSELDNAETQFKQAVAQADTIRATLAKKHIRAPFAGLLGIRLVNLGQFLHEGDAIVSLQSLDPIFVDFLLPQQEISRIRPGLSVRVTIDSLPVEVMEGTITAINPQVDAATRNIRIQATLANPREKLRPGMFAEAAVVLPGRNEVLAIPATSVLYAPYGDSVFVVEEKQNEQTGKPVKAVRQQFVRLGEKRGDFVSVVSGVREGEAVVSTGVFKLRNGQNVVVDNTLSPEFKLRPTPENK
ncbi:MAG: efflux RND transporter periplasmic adaptor subunit [Deltaproteobacteria bacterium]